MILKSPIGKMQTSAKFYFLNLQYSNSIFHFSPYTLTLSIPPSFRAIKNSNSYSEKLLNG